MSYIHQKILFWTIFKNELTFKISIKRTITLKFCYVILVYCILFGIALFSFILFHCQKVSVKTLNNLWAIQKLRHMGRRGKGVDEKSYKSEIRGRGCRQIDDVNDSIKIFLCPFFLYLNFCCSVSHEALIILQHEQE